MAASANNTQQFKENLSPASKLRWEAVVRRVMAETGDRNKAINIANRVTRPSIKRMLEKM